MNRICTISAVTALALSLPAATSLIQAEGACTGAVTVTGGDTLSGISRRCEVSLEALIEANDVEDPHRLRIGQTIVIPEAGWNRASGYVVGPGDTIGSIAAELRLPATSLMELNPRLESNDLPVGLVLRVPNDWARTFDAGRGPIATTGTITTVECPAVRGPDGQLYALAGAVADYRPGDQVTIEGETSDASWCVPGPTIEISDIRAAG